jgi:hypothetical protein
VGLDLLYLDLSHEERVAHAVEFIFFSLPRFVKGLHQLFFSHLSFLEHLCVAFSVLAVVCPAFAFPAALPAHEAMQRVGWLFPFWDSCSYISFRDLRG